MHILTNKGLRKAEQVEVQYILANLYAALGVHATRIKKPSPITDYRLGFVAGIYYSRGEIRKILDAYDDPDFIRDFLDGQED